MTIKTKFAIGQVVYMYEYIQKTIYKTTIYSIGVEYVNNEPTAVSFNGQTEDGKHQIVGSPESWCAAELDTLKEYLDSNFYDYNKFIG